MKLLAFVDIHGSITALNRIEYLVKKHNPDILLCGGDVSIFEQYLGIILKKLASLKKPLYIIHGNHESENTMKKLCERHNNVFFIHEKIKEFDKFSLAGYGGGGFSQVDKRFEKFAKKIHGKNMILMTHAPPYKTKLDHVHNTHVGCKSFRKFITTNNVILAISGHIHETAGKQDKIGNTLLVNPGPFGVIIEL